MVTTPGTFNFNQSADFSPAGVKKRQQALTVRKQAQKLYEAEIAPELLKLGATDVLQSFGFQENELTHDYLAASFKTRKTELNESIQKGFPMQLSPAEHTLARVEEALQENQKKIGSYESVLLQLHPECDVANHLAFRLFNLKQAQHVLNHYIEPAKTSWDAFWKKEHPNSQQRTIGSLALTNVILEKTPNLDRNELLVNAVKKDHLENIPMLLKGVPNLNRENRQGWNLTSLAAREGHSEAVAILEQHGGRNDLQKIIVDFAGGMAQATNDKDRSAVLKELLGETPLRDSAKAQAAKAIQKTISAVV